MSQGTTLVVPTAFISLPEPASAGGTLLGALWINSRSLHAG